MCGRGMRRSTTTSKVAADQGCCGQRPRRALLAAHFWGAERWSSSGARLARSEHQLERRDVEPPAELSPNFLFDADQLESAGAMEGNGRLTAGLDSCDH